MESLKGIVTALVTPFKEDGTFDKDNLKQLVNFQKQRVDGLFALGSSGEGILMSKKERKKALEITVDENNGKLPIIAHVGCINTKDTIELTKHAVKNNVDYISAITPFFFKGSDQAVINHYLAVSKAAESKPFFLYNNPALATNSISKNVLDYFYNNVSNFAGIKDSSKSLENLYDYRQIQKTGTVLVGGDRIVNESLKIGIDGAVSTLSNVFPELFTNLYKANQNKDGANSKYYQDIINKVLDILLQFPYFSCIKKLLTFRLENFSPCYCISPILNLNQKDEKLMMVKLREIKEIGDFI